MPRLRILPANLMLLAVGLADLLSTIFWLHTRQAVEFNPVMAAVLHGGYVQFVLVKLSTLTVYVGILEWYRHHRNPVFARAVGSFTLVAYLGIYAVSFCCVNYRILS